SAFEASFAFASRVEFAPVSLIGWLDQSPVTLQARNARATELDRTLFVASLPVDPTVGEDVKIPSGLIDRRSMIAGVGRISANNLVISTGETLMFEYSLPTRPDHFRVDDAALDLSGTTPGNAAIQDVAQASVYDWPSSAWR